jgi:hypothetical protein
MTKDVLDDKAFWFCNSSGPVGMVAHNIGEFSECLRAVSTDSLEFHLRDNKNDFASWLREIMEEPKFAESVKRIKNKDLKGEALKGSMHRLAKRMKVSPVL